MADEKAPPPPSYWDHPDPFVRIIWALLSLFVFLYIANGLLSMFLSGRIFAYGSLNNLREVLTHYWPYIQVISILLSITFLALIIWVYRKLVIVRRNEMARLYPVVEPTAAVNPRWERVRSHIDSLNENDWRQAILEADIMLDDLLDKLSLHGDTMADKLKSVEKSDFVTLDNAWEAHKVRNQIAHEGQAFALSSHEARRVIELYKSVFDEFKII